MLEERIPDSYTKSKGKITHLECIEIVHPDGKKDTGT